MSKPNLQIALDYSDLPSALEGISKAGEIVDIIECGTILLLQTGNLAIQSIRALFPNKKIVADTKCADAGTTVARNVAEAGADWMTCICSATIPTVQAAQKEVEEIQIELYGDWTIEQEDKWLDIGIRQVIYHQSRDALLSGTSWGEEDLNKVKQLVDKGFKVSVTGGLSLDTLKLFSGIDVYTFITGRGITSAHDPAKAAKDFQDEITQIWGK